MKAGLSLDNDKNNHNSRIFWMVFEIIKKVCFDILDYQLNRKRYSSFLLGKTCRRSCWVRRVSSGDVHVRVLSRSLRRILHNEKKFIHTVYLKNSNKIIMTNYNLESLFLELRPNSVEISLQSYTVQYTS